MEQIDWSRAVLPSEIIPYCGKDWWLSVKCGSKLDLALRNESIILTLPHETPILKYGSHIQIAILRWLKSQALQEVQHYVAWYAEKMGRAPRSCGVKVTKSRWGSLGIHNDLYINWLLILAPSYVLEYVVVHEMSHLFYRTHGPRFWSTVEKWMPDYKVAEKWLRKEGGKLMLEWRSQLAVKQSSK